MKILFFIAVWVNIAFFLWESNFENLDTDYEGDINATKQILLKSELPKNKNVQNQSSESSIGGKGVTELSVEEKDSKLVAGLIIKEDPVFVKKNKKVSAKSLKGTAMIDGSQNKQMDVKAEQNGMQKVKALKNKQTRLYAGHCYQVGPFENNVVFDEWKNLNNIDLASTVLWKKDEKTFKQYMVYYPEAESIEESNKNMGKIKKLGITDAWLFDKGEFKGGISLGLYDREEPAKLRIKEVSMMFIDAEIKVIQRKKSTLYAKISKINSSLDQVVFLSDKQVAIDCKIER